jgi:hypothetical protein
MRKREFLPGQENPIAAFRHGPGRISCGTAPAPDRFSTSTTRRKELAMSVPREPIPEKPPMPGPGWTPEPPIEEPDPDRLPDEIPVPNPDENEEPPKHA